MDVKNIYLYGASDDCHELETDFGIHAESYDGIKINDITVHYVFDGNWGIWLEGNIPKSWKIYSITGNAPREVDGKPYRGQFIHIQIPKGEKIKVIELRDDEDE